MDVVLVLGSGGRDDWVGREGEVDGMAGWVVWWGGKSIKCC